MNCLHTYEAKIYCKGLKVILTNEKGWKVCFYGQREEKPCYIISAMRASKLLCQGCEEYWCYAMNIREKEETTNNISIVCEFKNVFPEELSRLPPQREIDFETKLIPGSLPISKAP